jgi:hypothetical protein
MNSLPRPVALVVVANEPTGAEVVVEFAVMADVKKYSPAVPFAIVAPVVADEVNVELVMTAPVIVVPDTSSGSLYATPTGLVLGMFYPFRMGAEAPIVYFKNAE